MSISFYAATAPGTRPVNFGDFDARPNFHNGAALAVLRAMGLVKTDEEMWTAQTIHIGDFRRACLRVLNSTKRAAENTYAPSEGKGAGGAQYYIGGLDEEGILRRVQELLDWSERMMARGALVLWWG